MRQNLSGQTTQNLIAILPLGASEQHGPHLPADTDSVIAAGIAQRLNLACRGKHALQILPVEPVGYSPEHLDYPDTLSLDHEAAIRRWVSLGEGLAAQGIRKLILLNAHGGNFPLLSIVAMELRLRAAMLCVVTGWLRFGVPEGLLEDGEREFGIHGGDIETSVMLALAGEKVNMEKACNFDNLQRRLVNDNQYLHAYGRHGFGWKMQDLNLQGATGNATLATQAKGEALIAHAVHGLVGLVDEVARFDLALFDNRPLR